MWGLFLLCGDSAAIRTQDLLLRRQLLYPAELRGQILALNTTLCRERAKIMSGHPDSNWGSPAPKAGAITGLRYAPRYLLLLKKTPLGASFWRRRGDSNPRYPNRVRQFSKLLVSATHPPLRLSNSVKFLSKFRTAKVLLFSETTKFFSLFIPSYFFAA